MGGIKRWGETLQEYLMIGVHFVITLLNYCHRRQQKKDYLLDFVFLNIEHGE